mmetsp:Transcript_22286/g.63603  ORF Transcript_22286/g.63603 Transcript_22286/m.63603 type:complete len:197 (-) Transcript_22286:423-1013(-)
MGGCITCSSSAAVPLVGEGASDDAPDTQVEASPAEPEQVPEDASEPESTPPEVDAGMSPEEEQEMKTAEARQRTYAELNKFFRPSLPDRSEPLQTSMDLGRHDCTCVDTTSLDVVHSLYPQETVGPYTSIELHQHDIHVVRDLVEVNQVTGVGKVTDAAKKVISKVLHGTDNCIVFGSLSSGGRVGVHRAAGHQGS